MNSPAPLINAPLNKTTSVLPVSVYPTRYCDESRERLHRDRKASRPVRCLRLVARAAEYEEAARECNNAGQNRLGWRADAQETSRNSQLVIMFLSCIQSD